MSRAVILLLFLCSMAEAATFTATQTGNWASTATWGGVGPPGAGDRAVISCNCTVTIPASTSVTVGDSPVAGTAVVTISPLANNQSAVLINAGTLTLQGDLVSGPGGGANAGWVNRVAIYNMQGGSITQFSSPVGVSYRMVWPNQLNGTPYPLIESTATSWASPAILQTIAGNAGNNGYIFGNSDSAINLSYCKLINLGTASIAAIEVGGDLIFSHVLMTGSGQVRQDGDHFFGFASCMDYLDIRTPITNQPLNGVALTGTNTPTGCNRMTNSVIVASGSGFNLVMQWQNQTVTNTIFGIGAITIPATSGVMWNNVLVADPFGTPNNSAVQPGANAGFVWDGGANWANPAAFNMHSVTDGTTVAGAANVVQNVIVDGSGSTPRNGDLWVSPGVHYVNRVIAVNGLGTVEDATCASATSFGHVNHVTSEASDGGSGASTVGLNEFQANGCQLAQVVNLLADNNYNGICPGSNAAPYVQQTGLTYDYIWLGNRKDPDPLNLVSVRPWNSTTGHQGTLCDNWVSGSGSGGANISKGTTTVSSVTDANDLVLASTASINVGDYLYHNGSSRGAFVTAVPSLGHVTIGNDEDGVAGIPSAIAGQTLVILPDIWSSGVYGSAGKGQHEGYSDPRLINPKVTIETWDVANGGPGTAANARAEAYKVNGWDINGNAATFNPAYSLANYLAYIRHGLSPTSLAPKGFSSDATWAATTTYVVGQSVQDTALHLQICTKAGTSGGSAPAWNDLGGTTTDNTVTWTDQGIIDNPGAMPILVYNSPGITGGGVN